MRERRLQSCHIDTDPSLRYGSIPFTCDDLVNGEGRQEDTSALSEPPRFGDDFGTGSASVSPSFSEKPCARQMRSSESWGHTLPDR